MNKNKIIGFIIFLSLFVPLGFYLISNYSLESVAYLDAIEASRDQEIGEISMTDGVKQVIFKYRNNSDQPITLNELYTSCMCTKVKLIVDGEHSYFAGMKGHKSGLKPINPNMTLQPGQVAELFAEFDPNAHGPDAVGPMTRTVFLGTNGDDTQIKFNFSGDVIK